MALLPEVAAGFVVVVLGEVLVVDLVVVDLVVVDAVGLVVVVRLLPELLKLLLPLSR